MVVENYFIHFKKFNARPRFSHRSQDSATSWPLKEFIEHFILQDVVIQLSKLGAMTLVPTYPCSQQVTLYHN